MPEIKTKVPSIVVEGAEISFEYFMEHRPPGRTRIVWRAIWEGGGASCYEAHKGVVISATGRTPRTAFKACMGKLYDFLFKTFQ